MQDKVFKGTNAFEWKESSPITTLIERLLLDALEALDRVDVSSETRKLEIAPHEAMNRLTRKYTLLDYRYTTCEVNGGEVTTVQLHVKITFGNISKKILISLSEYDYQDFGKGGNNE